ncbi:MAG: signal peptidase I [Clostridia bacterium]|nr:signal peptidase I [Clostridia bacterium]
MKNGNTSTSHKILSFVGIVLCVILVPILLINLTLIAKSYINKDEVPQIGGFVPLVVLTDSMEPVIDGGDLIICRTIDPKEIKEKDIIAFIDPAGNGTSILTHRVVEIVEQDGSRYFRTKGDFNNIEDKDLVPAEDLIGLYKSRIPAAGHVAMFMQSTPGLILCVVLPIVLLVAYDFIRRRLYEKNQKTDTDALMAELEALRAEKAEKEAAAAVTETEPAAEVADEATE